MKKFFNYFFFVFPSIGFGIIFTLIAFHVEWLELVTIFFAFVAISFPLVWKIRKRSLELEDLKKRIHKLENENVNNKEK